MDLSIMPLDVVRHIYNYVYEKCDKCNDLYEGHNLIKNCRIFKYRNVYLHSITLADEYVERYNFICTNCTKSYCENTILNIDNNIYKWIK